MDFKKIYNYAVFHYVKNRKYIELGFRSIKTIYHVAKKNYADSFTSLVDIANNLNNNYWSLSDVLRSSDGWCRLFSYTEDEMSSLFNLSKFPCKTITVQDGTIHFYSLSDTIEVVMWQSKWHGDANMYLYNTNCNNKDDIIKFLISDLFKTLNSDCVVLSSNEEGGYHRRKSIMLIPYELPNYMSEISNNLSSYLKKSISLNIPRSVMLYSEPGTGKSCIAGASLHQLGLKTLKIDNFNKINNSIIQLLIENLKFEAILIDDLDHMHINNNNSVLDFLERIRKHVKIVIATVNSTKPFHKALLRPGRFDKIIPVHSLDEQVIKNTLGNDLVSYFEKVKDWPIAFINELSISSKLEEAMTIDEIIEKLQKRVGANNKEDTIDLEAKAVTALEAAKTTAAPTKVEIEDILQKALKNCA